MANAKGRRAGTGRRARGPVCLVGDIGGTRTRLALHDAAGRAPLSEAVLPSRDHATFEEIAERFLAESGAPHPTVGVFGVAGPVHGGRVDATNLPWKLDERSLARRLRIERVVLANDLVVGACGCLSIGAEDRALLTADPPARKGKNLGVIAAGTGLGEARLVWAGERYHALPTEGGHCDFAPRTPLEVELWSFLSGRYPDHVSYERVVSGAGLGMLYEFFSARGGREPKTVGKRLAEGDRNAVIAELGLARAYRPAAQAVDLFASIYGAEAGNLALRELALGGIWVTGNIGKVIVPARREQFLDGFLQKGRFRDLLATVPIAVATDPLVGLRGALALARELAAPATGR